MEPNARLSSRRAVAPGLAIFRVRPDGVRPEGAPALDFEPGQFVRLGLPDPARRGELLQRAYSIASAPREPELEFFLRRVDDGRLTPGLFELAPGAPLHVEPRANGHFTLAGLPPASDVLMVATGTGVAPFVSMLRHHARTAPRPWRAALLVHGARHAAELGYRAELDALAASDAGITYVPVLSGEPGEWPGARGRVQALLERSAWSARAPFELDPTRVHALLCGNPAMIADVGARLEALGFRRHRRSAPGNLRTERYW